MNAGHPSSDRLVAFALGLLSQAEAAAITTHLGGCEGCAAAVDTVPDDAFVTLLRDSVATPAWERAQSTAGGGRAAAATVPDRPPDVPAALATHPHYRILRFLGAGGMGAVYLAEHQLMDRRVALKVIDRQLTERPLMVERFQREMKAIARLAHPNIVGAFDAERVGDIYFLVMEYVAGTTLAQLVEANGPLTVVQACDYVRQAALGLQHAFEAGLVHRDLKPQNLMLTAAADAAPGIIKVLDFGLARIAHEPGRTLSLTDSGTVVGTPDYLAPEQARDPQQADIRSDIYSLGCTLYYLLAGQPPFPKGLAIQKVLAHLDQAPRPVTAFRSDVPPELAQVLDQMLAKDPGRRYQTPAEVANALAPYAGSAVAALASTPRANVARRTRVWWLLLALGLLALTVVAGVFGIANLNRVGSTERSGVASAQPSSELLPEVRRYQIGVGPLNRAAFSADAHWALAADKEGKIHRWDLERGQAAGTLEGHEGDVLSLAFSADGRQALSGAQDATVRLWDLQERRTVQILRGHKSWVRGVAFCPEDRRALSGGNDGLVIVWDLATGMPERVLTGHLGAIGCVCAAPGGRLALSGSWDRTARTWDLDTGLRVRSFSGHEDGISSAVFARDGALVLTGSADGTVRLWETASAKQVAQLDGHTAPVVCVALSADGRWAASGGVDKTVRLWDLRQRREIGQCEGHDETVLTVAFHPDGRRLLSGSKDGTLRLWQLPKSLRSD